MDDLANMALPQGWAWARLDELCDVIGGITVDAKRRGPGLIEVPYLRVANVQRAHLNLNAIKQIMVTPEQLERLRLRSGDVLLNEGGDRDKVGRGWVWEGQIENCIFQNHIFRARPRHQDVQSRWLSYYLNETARPYFLAGSKQTTNLASISLSKVAATPIAVPPVLEQQRMVAEIDGLLADIADVEAAIKRAAAQTVECRTSILYAALSARLVPQISTEEPATGLLARIRATSGSGVPRRRRSTVSILRS